MLFMVVKKILFLAFGLVVLYGIIFLFPRVIKRVTTGGVSQWNEIIDAAFAPYDCPPHEPRTYPPGYYSGPLFDAHIHIPSIPDDSRMFGRPELVGDLRPSLGVNVTVPKMACLFETEETDSVLAFFPVWPELPEQMVEVARRAEENYPNLFLPFIMPPNHDDDPNGAPTVDAATLSDMLAIAPGLFDGYGEIGLYERDGGSRELPPDSALLQDIYPVVRDERLLVYFHLGFGHEDEFDAVLDAYPEITFIFHGDQLIEYGRNGRQDLSRVDKLLTDHPNLRYGVDELYGDDFLIRPEVTKEEFLAHFDDYEPLLEEDLATWKAFIEKHPDQVLWDTDRGGAVLWSLDQEVGLRLTDYARAFIGRLDPAVQEKYAYQNALNLTGE